MADQLRPYLFEHGRLEQEEDKKDDGVPLLTVSDINPDMLEVRVACRSCYFLLIMESPIKALPAKILATSMARLLRVEKTVEDVVPGSTWREIHKVITRHPVSLVTSAFKYLLVFPWRSLQVGKQRAADRFSSETLDAMQFVKVNSAVLYQTWIDEV